MFYKHLHDPSCDLFMHGEEAPQSKEAQLQAALDAERARVKELQGAASTPINELLAELISCAGVFDVSTDYEGDRKALETATQAVLDHVATLRAQLRQVEGERVKDVSECVSLTNQLEQANKGLFTLRQLVEALPVAGLPVEHARSDDFVVLQANGEWMVHTYNYWAKFATEDEARAYIALLEYRASLPAQPAQGGA